MLSKAKGQVIHVAALMHLLFQDGIDDTQVTCISTDSIKAAINFVEVCCQHAAFLAGRGTIDDEIQTITSGMTIFGHECKYQNIIHQRCSLLLRALATQLSLSNHCLDT